MDVMIVDKFLQFPKQVREWALNQTYRDSQQFKEHYGINTDWPGLRSDAVYDLDAEYADIVFSAVANIIQRNRVTPLRDLSIRSFFQVTRIQDGASWIHQDNNVKYAAILYLSPNADPIHGTTLYRCNDVQKWESYMSDQEGYQTLMQINEAERTDLYTELFTPVDVIGNVFNRLVIYKGDIYHKSSFYFGNDIKSGRLTQVFFINGE